MRSARVAALTRHIASGARPAAAECAVCDPPEPGTVDAHAAHVFFVTPGRTNWAKDVRDEDDMARALFTALMPPADATPIKLTATNGEFDIAPPAADAPERTATLVIFPARLAVRIAAGDVARVSTVLQEHYRGAIDNAAAPAYLAYRQPKRWQSDQLELLGKLTNARDAASHMTVHALSNTVRHLFVCTHANRDSRCGRAGETMFPLLKTFAHRHTATDAAPIKVHTTSHIGGHKYAGNVVDYGEGDWYGGVNMQNAEHFFASIAQGLPVPELWRGRVGMTADAQRDLAARMRNDPPTVHAARPPTTASEVTVFVTDKNGMHKLRGLANERLMTVLKRNNIAIEGACGGNMECATCHVVLEGDWADNHPPASDVEHDMLDMLDGVQDGSRLSCQILLQPKLNGIQLRLPSVKRSGL